MTVRLLLRLEGLAIAVGAVVLYADGDHSWWLFALLILAPDLSFLGYLAGPRLGAAAYNLLHNLVLPVALGTAAVLADWTPPRRSPDLAGPHRRRSVDRLRPEVPAAFKDSHLQRV